MEHFTDLSGWFSAFLPQLLAAFVAGTLLGLERQRRHSPIGVRTCTLVCAGSTAYMATGHLILTTSSMPGDPTRIAGQIITGIGFLGAGAIIRERGGVHGLTSAATIWFLGAIGVLIGCRYALAGLGLSIAIVVLLFLVSWLEQWIGPRDPHSGEATECSPSDG